MQVFNSAIFVFDIKSFILYNASFGLSLGGGARLEISKKIDFFADIRYDFAKMSIESFDEKASLGGGKFHVGFVYKFSF